MEAVMDRPARRAVQLTMVLVALAGCGIMGKHASGQALSPAAPVAVPLLTWEQTANLNAARAGLGLAQGEVASERHLYAVAGETTGGAILPTTERSQLATPLTAWGAGGADLPEPLAYQGTLAVNGRVYVIGGWNGSTNLKTVRSAQISQSGSLGAWTLGEPLPSSTRGRSALAVVSYAKDDATFIYALGGWDGYGPTDTIFRASAGQDGALTWILLPTRLPEPLFGLSGLVFQDGLYVIGGQTTSGRSRHIYRYLLESDGSLGSRSQLADLPEERDSLAAVIYENALVVLGGRNAKGQSTDTVYVASLAGDGSLVLPWDTQSLPQALEGHRAVVANIGHCGEVIYVVGGRNDVGYKNTVYRTECPSPEAWSAWGSEGNLLVCESISVPVLYGNQTGEGTLIATLNPGAPNGPVVFADDTYAWTVDLFDETPASGAYDLEFKRSPGSAIGQTSTLHVELDGSAVEPDRSVEIAQCSNLPLILKNAP
jgi:hypothetical protein